MKTWKTWLFAVLCCGAFLGWWLVGCGGSNESRCERACHKINACGALWVTGLQTEGECVNKCLNHFEGLACVLDCDEGQSCNNYGQCVLETCNPPQP
jgi:hypothetical protein